MSDIDTAVVDRSEAWPAGQQLSGAFAAALVEASAELSDVARSQEANAGQYSYRFAGLSDFLAVVRPVLHRHGLAHMQRVATEPFDKGINVCIETVLVHSSGATFTSPVLRLVVTSFDAQKVGSAITYGRRYSLTTTLGIAGRDDDDDGHAVAQTAPKQVRKGAEPASYRTEIEAETRRLLNATPAEIRTEIQRQFLDHFGLPLSKMPKDRHAEALAFVTERLAPADDQPLTLE